MSPLAPLWITPEIHRGQLGDSVIHRHGDSNGDSTRKPLQYQRGQLPGQLGTVERRKAGQVPLP